MENINASSNWVLISAVAIGALPYFSNYYRMYKGYAWATSIVLFATFLGSKYGDYDRGKTPSPDETPYPFDQDRNYLYPIMP